jgi:hypothetical protein
MIGGIIVGLIAFIILSFILYGCFDIGWEWNLGAKILFWLLLFVIVVGIITGIGIWIDDADTDQYIATWNMTKTSYEQAMGAYESYDSMIKDNPELIKEAIAKNEQLASYQYAATRWWYWYLDDSIQNLEPIIIGGTK